MPKYCFILGNNPVLSLAEIFNYEVLEKNDFKIIDLTSETLIIETVKLDPQKWQDRLGGTIKIGQITENFHQWKEIANYLKATNLSKDYFSQKERKIIFGFSLYGDLFRHHDIELNKIGLNIKKQLQTKKVNSRFVFAKDNSLSAVQIQKNKILEKGADILIIFGIHQLYVGKSLSIQDFEDYSFRDYGRPKRDPRSGMLPPKIAKIMVNLLQAKPRHTILDPFCGSGTILQELLLLGYKKIIGSDIDEKAIANTKENLNWVAEEYKLPTKNFELHKHDVKNLTNKIESKSISCIVTEPYLGPPSKKDPPVKKMEKIISELEALYLASFDSFDKILKPQGRIVMVFPLFRHSNGVFTLRILETLEQRGFKRLNPIPEKVSLFAKVGPTARGSLIYRREDQKIEREIFVFQKETP